MQKSYRDWLVRQQYAEHTIASQCSMANRIEQAYGDLDDLYDTNRIGDVAASLRYSAIDSRRFRPNPSQIKIEGDPYKSLASYRAALGLYRRFRSDTGHEPLGARTDLREGAAEPRVDSNEDLARIGLERDLQTTLRRSIRQLDPDLSIIDDGVERNVASGFIDITARDGTGTLVVIELKAGIAGRGAVAQILSYMGDLVEEEATPVRGILVAHAFDAKAKAAASMVPNLVLRAYAVAFTFSDASGTSSQERASP